MSHFLRAITLSLLIAFPSRALTTTSFVPVHTGVFDDSDLTGFTTYAYRLDTDREDWFTFSLEVILAEGVINHLDPGFLQTEASINGFGDTAGFAPTNVVGDLTTGYRSDAFFEANHVESSTYFQSNWASGSTGGVGAFDVGMITLSQDANGTLAYVTDIGNETDLGPGQAPTGVRDSLYPDYNIVNGKIVPFEGPIPAPNRPDVEPPTTPTAPLPTGPSIASTEFVPVKTGKLDDASLPGFTTYAYRVDAPIDWTNSDLLVSLTSGTINHLEPEFLGSPNGVNGFGDSAGMAPLNELGDLTSGFHGTVGYPGDHVETPTELKTHWFTTDTDNIGTFDIGTITLSDDANGTLAFRTIFGSTIHDGPSGQGLSPDYNIVNGQLFAVGPDNPPVIPNPPTNPTHPPTNPPNSPTNPPTRPTGPPMLPDPPTGDAATSTTFVPVDNGVFDNPSLAGFNTFAMRVTATDDWTNADLEISLTEGTIAHAAPAFLGSPNGVAGFGDSAAIAPTNVLGDVTQGFNGNVGFAGEHLETPTQLKTSWFTTNTDDIGTFDIAMITLSDDANGTIAFRTIAGSKVEEGGFSSGQVEFTIRFGQIVNVRSVVPEPGAFALAALGVMPIGLARTRQWRLVTSASTVDSIL